MGTRVARIKRWAGGRTNFGFVPTEKLNFNVNVGYVRTRKRMPLNNNASNGVLRNAYRGRAFAFDDPWKPGYRGSALSSPASTTTRSGRSG